MSNVRFQIRSFSSDGPADHCSQKNRRRTISNSVSARGPERSERTRSGNNADRAGSPSVPPVAFFQNATTAHDELVRLVDRRRIAKRGDEGRRSWPGMLDLHKQRAPLPESAERQRVEREIEATDRKIDEIVYRLYGITEEERKIIEGRA